MTAQVPMSNGAEAPSEEDQLALKVAEAKAAVASLGDQFLSFIADDVSKLSQLVNDAKTDLDGRMDHIQGMFHIAHNLKGQGASFGYNLLTEVADRLCYRTRDVTQVDDACLDAIGFHVRAIQVIVDGQINGMGGEKGAALLTKLSALPAPVFTPVTETNDL